MKKMVLGLSFFVSDVISRVGF